MTTRSDRNTGNYRSYRGSGAVGRIPVSKPGNPRKLRRKTKPLNPAMFNPIKMKSQSRGYRQIHTLIMGGIRATKKRRPRLTKMREGIRKAILGRG